MLKYKRLSEVEKSVTDQGGFTEELAAAHQIADGHVKVGVATAPVGDLCEWMSGQDLLQTHTHTHTHVYLHITAGVLDWDKFAVTGVSTMAGVL